MFINFFMILKLFIFKKFDVIISPSVPLTTSLAGLILKFCISSKFFFEIRDVWPDSLVYNKIITKRNPFFWFLKFIEILCYKFSTAIITTLPDTWGIGEKFLMLPINKWQNEYQRVVLGGLTCDSHDYYDSEEHINEVFLPKITGDDSKEPLYLGFFHTGAYQDQISGYGGIKHCMIPSPKHIIVGKDKHGKLHDWIYAKEQTAQSMLKILGYQ
jgi:hypothetical protein